MKLNIFQAIAQPNCKAIIILLILQAMATHAIAGHLHASRQAVFNHIQILNECWLVGQKETSREIHYYLLPQKLMESMIGRIRSAPVRKSF